MKYVIVVNERVAQVSSNPIEVAPPITCFPVADGTDVDENWIVQQQSGEYTFKPPAEYASQYPSLKDLAQTALQNIMSKAPSLTVMGEVFGPNTRAYVQKLQAIANGEDTTSTELPSVPSDLRT